jgi:predicted Zn-dependent peptidase
MIQYGGMKKMVEFFKKKLKNGLTVLFEKRNIPVTSVSTSVKFGAAYEQETNKGVAHFMEHLMFKGTKTRGYEEIAREIEKKGGILNAYTSEEVTCYWNKMPSKYLKTGIDISSDLILNPKFDQEEFEREKGVIIEEIKMYHDTPAYYVVDKMKEMLYEKPFGMSIAGKEKVIRGMTRDHVSEIFNSVYSTDSMTLCVVGNANFEEICAQAEETFPAKRRKMIEHSSITRNMEMVEQRGGIDQANFMIGFHSSPIGSRKRYVYDLAGAYLFGGMSSRLFQEIREKRALAYSVKGDFDIGKNYGYCMISVGTMKEKISEIKKIILKEIGDLKNLKQKDFDECKEQLIGSRKVAEEDSSSVMNALVMEENGGDAEEYYQFDERVNSVKLGDVRKLARLEGYSSFSLIPK